MIARLGAKVQSTMPPAASVAGSGTPAALAEGVVPSLVIEASDATEDLTDLGVDTLWLVTLTSLNKEVADSATIDLLSVRRPLFDRAVQIVNTVVREKRG